MNSTLKVVVPLAIVGFTILGAGALVNLRPKPTRARPVTPPPLVRVLEARAATVALDVTSQGEVRPRTATTLVAEVGGRVVDVRPRLAAGEFFEKGDLLARIDPRDYRVAIAAAEAQLAQADVALAREEGEARVARADWEALGEGKADPLVLREPQLAGARAVQASARAALDKAKLDLARTEIRAPYDGRVRARSVDVGQFLPPGTPVAQVYATDAAEIRLGLPADRVGDLDLSFVFGSEDGPAVVLRARFAGKWMQWTGRVVRVEGEIDPTTRMLHVIARVDDPFGLEGGTGRGTLPSGLFVEAEIEGRSVEDAYVIPREALREGSAVFVVRDGRLRRLDVDVVRVVNDEAVVRGLEDGVLVCISNPAVAIDGMAVRTEYQAEPDAATVQATP